MCPSTWTETVKFLAVRVYLLNKWARVRLFFESMDLMVGGRYRCLTPMECIVNIDDTG